MDSWISSGDSTGETQSSRGGEFTFTGAESSFGIVTAFRDMFMYAFSAISVVHQTGGDEAENDNATRCNFYSGADDVYSRKPRLGPLAVATDYNALQDSAGRRVVITPTRRKVKSGRPRMPALVGVDNSDSDMSDQCNRS